MKKQKRIFIIVMICVSIWFSLLTIQTYAENKTITNNITTQNSSNSKEDNNTTNTENKEETKSSNANLANLGIKPHDFTGFRYGTTTYEVVVPEDTEEVEVYAELQDSKATLTGTGKKKLELGENKVEVTITAEDETKKTYTINIIREVNQEGDEEEQTIDIEDAEGLSELKINDLTLTPEFKTNIYEYTVDYIGEDTKLQIETNATNKDYIVEVIGNENLKEGENIITILVSEKNENNIATYQVTVNKSLVDYEAIAKEKMQRKIIIGIIITVIIIGIIIFIIIKRRKNYAEEYSEGSFYGINNDKDYEENYEKDDEDELPKALRESKSTLTHKQDIYNDIYEEESIEKMTKEEIKEKFLDNYNSNSEYNYKEKDERSHKKAKGKRFK